MSPVGRLAKFFVAGECRRFTGDFAFLVVCWRAILASQDMHQTTQRLKPVAGQRGRCISRPETANVCVVKKTHGLKVPRVRSGGVTTRLQNRILKLVAIPMWYPGAVLVLELAKPLHPGRCVTLTRKSPCPEGIWDERID